MTVQIQGILIPGKILNAKRKISVFSLKTKRNIKTMQVIFW